MTAMAIVPVSPKPFYLSYSYFSYVHLIRGKMYENSCFQTLLPGLGVVLEVSGASVVFRVSADSSVEVIASENMHCV